MIKVDITSELDEIRKNFVKYLDEDFPQYRVQMKDGFEKFVTGRIESYRDRYNRLHDNDCDYMRAKEFARDGLYGDLYFSMYVYFKEVLFSFYPEMEKMSKDYLVDLFIEVEDAFENNYNEEYEGTQKEEDFKDFIRPILDAKIELVNEYRNI